jgi:hypothetical protein
MPWRKRQLHLSTLLLAVVISGALLGVHIGEQDTGKFLYEIEFGHRPKGSTITYRGWPYSYSMIIRHTSGTQVVQWYYRELLVDMVVAFSIMIGQICLCEVAIGFSTKRISRQTMWA